MMRWRPILQSVTGLRSLAGLRSLIGALAGAAMLLLGLWPATPASAAAEQRFALLIGNAGYSGAIEPLTNPHNDIALLEGKLKALGFEVTTVPDASLGVMTRAINRYVARLRRAGPGAVGFFYYSGHGAQNAETRINYLIPTDVTTDNSTELWTDSYRLRDLIVKLKDEAPDANHFVVFDACRNELRLKSPDGKTAAGQAKGFRPEVDLRGILVAYATEEGAIASDAGSGAGPYASVLAEYLTQPGIEAVTMFRQVQLAVQSRIGQKPYLDLGGVGEVYLAGREAAIPAPPAPTISPPLSEAAQAWAHVTGSRNAALLEAFIAQYPVTVQAILAGDQLAALGTQMAAVTKPTAQVPQSGSYNPGQTFRDCESCPEMVVIPAGEFMMGSVDGGADERPVHKVTIGRPFAVGKFEVTFREWDACVADGGCGSHKPDDRGWGRGRQPVINVSWNDAASYLGWLSKKTGQTYRLLSEAEWEYAARAGTTTAYSWGNQVGKGNANCDGCGSQWDNKQSAPVGSFGANAFGLHDMHGNVWEWVEDPWHDSYAGAPQDGSVWSGGDSSFRVVRGGSWYDNPRSLRSANRYRSQPVNRYGYLGFRVARTLTP